ncbi:MAG: GntR family transcriptional regulator [Ancalomicrobiaceae bacterium]|nr:GntR family transcriptional regulator [Ancalomicrobiaceae bacterium]
MDLPARSAAKGERAASQTLRAQLMLRSLIIGGKLRPGERVSELQMVDRLGVSRTPVRAALIHLEHENLVEALPTGGYAVKELAEPEILVSIEIRGTLEGLAARMAAERGAAPQLIAAAREALDLIDAVVEPVARPVNLEHYVNYNARFHDLIVEMAGSDTLARQIERASVLPFASPSALVLLEPDSVETYQALLMSQLQHRTVLAAVELRQGTRAEAMMREHARTAHSNLQRALAAGRKLAELAVVELGGR